jgi:putative DNA primase/helicase
MRQAALEYALLDWRVFPCHWMKDGRCSCGKDQCSAGKHPLTPNGCKDATTDRGRIEVWWANFPDANIGIATGPSSGIWVLDVDGPDGIAALQALEKQHGPLPVTVTARTGSGGQHLYFAYPPGREIKNRTKIGGLPLDVRGDGGYVIAPPSTRRVRRRLLLPPSGCCSSSSRGPRPTCHGPTTRKRSPT